MCRKGKVEDNTHCQTCGYCVPNSSKHKCLENVGTSKCPVCMEEMIYSTTGYVPMKCGHLIHVDCWRMLKDINCPTCGMANFKMRKHEITHIDT